MYQNKSIDSILYWIIDRQKNFKGNIYSFLVIGFPASGMAPSGAGTLTGTVVIKFKSCIYTGSTHWLERDVILYIDK